jgi:PBSX family phage terminase large subunit
MSSFTFPPPNEKQALFLTDTHKYIGFGGARGGGKSWAVRVKAVLLCLNYPGIKVMIIRRTYPELQENHIIPLCEMLHCHAEDKTQRVASYNDAKKHITFPNGSRILFRYCDNEKDADRFQGTEVDVLFVDEATHQSEAKMDKLSACVRGVNSYPKRIYYTCNPGGVGHAWVKRLFVDRQYKPGENPDDYSFIRSLVRDNLALMQADPEYVRKLEALPPKLRKAWLDGDWDIYEGQFFEEFADRPEHYTDRQWTHVIEPFEIPDGWRIYRSFDWGYAKPFSCAWWAVDYDGVVYRILELYGCTDTPNEGVKWTPERVFAEIHRIETEHRWLRGKTIQGVADPAIWDAETGESIADVATRYRVYFDKGDHARLPGWMQVHYRLYFDDNGYPMMYVFKNCKAFIRTMPLLQYDEHRVEDLDTDGEDHVADEVRYFLMTRPIKPRKAPLPEAKQADPLKMFLDIDPADIMPAQRVPRMEIIHGDVK